MPTIKAKPVKPAPAAKLAAKTAPKPAARTATKAAAKPKPASKAKTSLKAAPKAAAAKAPNTSPVKSAARPAKAATTPAKAAALKKPATKAVVAKKAAPKLDAIGQLAMDVAKVLDTNKAMEIVTIPLAGRSPLADWMVIASGTSARQVGALANYVQRAFTQAGYKRLRTEGLPQGDWVVVDSGDVVVHLFRPEVRDFYQLDRLWLDEEGEPKETRRLK